jgi:hypothetical protein
LEASISARPYALPSPKRVQILSEGEGGYGFHGGREDGDVGGFAGEVRGARGRFRL